MSLIFRFRKQFNALGAIAWFVFGAILLAFRITQTTPNDLRALVGSEPELVTVRGILTAEPEHRVLDHDRKTRYRTTARIHVDEIERFNKTEKASGELAVSTIGFLPEEFIAGTRVEIAGVLSQPQGPIAPGLFDFERY